MLTEELLCIENLLEHVLNNAESISNPKMERILFNKIIIKNILKNASNYEQIDLKKLVQESPNKPIIETKFSSYEELYFWIIEALKKEEYEFTKKQEVYISSEHLDMIIPIDWLYRLSVALKPQAEVFTFNKKKMRKITSPNELKKYLEETKTIYIEFPKKKEYSTLYEEACDRINFSMQLQERVSTEKICQLLKFNLPDCFEVQKFVPSSMEVLKRAKERNSKFYTEPIRVQQRLLKEWLVSQVKANAIADEYGAMYLLSKEVKNKNRVVSSLISLYFLLMEKQQEKGNLSLSDFRIKEYQSEQQQENRIRCARTIYSIEEKNRLQTEIEELKNSLVESNESTENILKKVAFYRAEIAKRSNLEEERNVLQNQIHYQVEQDKMNLYFDYEKISRELSLCASLGRISVSEIDANKVVFERYNGQITRPIFLATISLNHLMDYIKSNNILLEEQIKVGK